MRALVTGGAIRLGREIALYLGEQGFDVAVHYAASADAARATASEIEAIGQKSVALQADLLDEAQSQSLVSRAVDALGGSLSLLVNNASIFEHDTIDTATRSSWDRHMESNLRAPFVLTQEFAKQAPEYKLDKMNEPMAQALVINMLDQRVRKLTPDFMSYTLAKMGLWAFTQTAARALAPNIRVNAIGPGPTVQGVRQSPQHFTRQRAETVLGRGSNPSDITAALGYFLKAPAITGQLLCVDGGQHLGWQTPDVLGLDG
tara:strand:+ start:140 stop:919 length:780 start_codon:yes stop_codon:yes gene_type:complete